MVLVRSNCPLAWSWYYVVVHGFTPNSSLIAWNTLDVYCGPFFVKALDDIPKFATESLMKKVTTVSAVVFGGEMALMSFEILSVSSTTNGLLLCVFGIGPRILIAITSNGPVGRNMCSCRCVLFVLHILVHVWQSPIIVYTSLTTCGQ